MDGTFKNVIVGPRERQKLKELRWSAIELRDSVDMFAAVDAGVETMMEEMARAFAKELDEQAKKEPTAIIYSDGIARVGMYKVAPNADEVETGRLIEKIVGQIWEELVKAGLDEYENQIQKLKRQIEGVGLCCGAFVDVPAEKWIDYKQSKERVNHV